MYNTLVLIAFLFVLSMMLVHWKPKGVEAFVDASGGDIGIEPFAVAAVDPVRMPACAARSASAQSLLARFATIPETSSIAGSYGPSHEVKVTESNDAASELRLLISKLCCIEADIKTPAAGTYRTATLQFRTSHDMEPASTLVGRALAGAVQARDVSLIMDKFNKRGAELIKAIFGGDCADATADFAAVSNTTRAALASTVRPVPTMDHPIGARDLGFWEPERVADLSQYQGISAQPK